jgi:hypothetical protein
MRTALVVTRASRPERMVEAEPSTVLVLWLVCREPPEMATPCPGHLSPGWIVMRDAQWLRLVVTGRKRATRLWWRCVWMIGGDGLRQLLPEARRACEQAGPVALW